MVVDFGYGVDMSQANFKKGAAKYVLTNYAAEEILDDFKEFCAEYPDLVEDGSAEACFADEYEDNIYYTSGLEAIIVKSINVKENTDAFMYDDYCIYVGSRIPLNDNQRALMLTMEDINRILAKYLGPILEGDLVIESLVINN